MAEAHQFLYFIVARPDGYKKDEYAVRIGTSNNVKETRLLLESAGWADLRTYSVFQGGIVGDLERSAHEKFAAVSLKRGWFRIKKADLDAHISTLEMIEGVKYTQESKAKVSKRAAKKKDGAEDRDEDTVEEKPKPKPRPEDVKPKAPEPKARVEEAKPKVQDVRPRTEDAKTRPRAEDAKPKVPEPKAKPVWDEPKIKPKKTPGRLDEFDDRSLDWN